MNQSMLWLFGVLAAIFSLVLPSGAANAQSMQIPRPDSSSDYPRKSVRLVVPFAPGGGTDIIARMLAQKVGGAWGQSIVVDNRAGAGGTIGTNTVAKAPPDGYTLLLSSVSIAYLPALYSKLPYDTEKELVPVALIVTQPSIVVVHPAIPAASVAEFIAVARSRRGEIRYSSGGSGSASHLAVELFRTTAKIDLVHVPYKGGGPAITSLVGGETQMMISNIVTLLPHVKSGRIRALAVTGVTRAKALPELPTVAEAGLPGSEFDGWYGLLVTAGSPSMVVRKINEAFNRALAAQDVRERFADAGFEPLGGTQEKFAAYLKAETRKWTAVVREANIRID